LENIIYLLSGESNKLRSQQAGYDKNINQIKHK